MTSHSNIPKAFASVEEYNKFYQHVHRETQKETLLREARMASAWGRPDNESIGLTPSEFIKIINKLVRYIEQGD